MRGPALLSILGNFHILALHIPAAVLLIVPLFEFFERHEVATATVRRLSIFSATGTWAAVLCGIFHAHFNGFSGDSINYTSGAALPLRSLLAWPASSWRNLSAFA